MSLTTGAEALMQTAVRAGIDLCFANPGTTEMPLVQALDAVSGVRAVLGLFEGVCTGAADGYARIAERPALTLLHLGPGLGNGIANLHNARRARTPVVNLIGDHATWHAGADAPLASDIESLASPVSGWVHTAKSAEGLATDMAEAVAAARRGRVATLIVPSDCAWGEARGPAAPQEPEPFTRVEEARVDSIAQVVRGSEPCALLLGPAGTRGPGLASAGRIAAATGCTLFCDTFPTRIDRGAGHPPLDRLPYFPEQALEALAPFGHLIVAGTRPPVAFFGYPGGSSSLVPETCRVHELAASDEDVVGALESLAEALGTARQPVGAALEVPDRPSGPLNPQTLGVALAALQPEGAIVMDESATSGFSYAISSRGCPPHIYLGLTGGAIGQGLPCATGAALASPDQTVLALQADGSAAYTVQALWTQAREGLRVKTILCSNRAYRILQVELARSGVAEPGPQALSLTDLTRPDLDWVELARGFGVPGARVSTADELVRELERTLEEPGPFLIEALL
jgi:acetolactate synthase-1/2/3 large subunit